MDRTGYLTVYLRNRGSASVYEAFEWVVQGYRPPGFPARFVGYVEPGHEVVVYKAYLPRIINRTGRYRIIIMSSEVLTFNVSMASRSEILKVKELVSKITPILRIECSGSRPVMCRALLPKYSLYIEVEVGTALLWLASAMMLLIIRGSRTWLGSLLGYASRAS